MALDRTGLALLAYANGFRIWQYRSTDTLATIMADAYFDAASDILYENDKIYIEGSDGLWEDFVGPVVTTAGSEDVAIGLQAGTVDDSLVGARYQLGGTRKRWDGSWWMYLEADAAVAAMDVVIVHSDYGSNPLTTTNGAVATGLGKTLAVAAETLSQSIATGDFYWGCLYAPAGAGVKFNAVASVEDYEDLYSSTTAGHLTDVFDADQLVLGIHSTEADDVEPVGVINWPMLNDTTNA